MPATQGVEQAATALAPLVAADALNHVREHPNSNPGDELRAMRKAEVELSGEEAALAVAVAEAAEAAEGLRAADAAAAAAEAAVAAALAEEQVQLAGLNAGPGWRRWAQGLSAKSRAAAASAAAASEAAAAAKAKLQAAEAEVESKRQKWHKCWDKLVGFAENRLRYIGYGPDKVKPRAKGLGPLNLWKFSVADVLERMAADGAGARPFSKCMQSADTYATGAQHAMLWQRVAHAVMALQTQLCAATCPPLSTDCSALLVPRSVAGGANSLEEYMTGAAADSLQARLRAIEKRTRAILSDRSIAVKFSAQFHTASALMHARLVQLKMVAEQPEAAPQGTIQVTTRALKVANEESAKLLVQVRRSARDAALAV